MADGLSKKDVVALVADQLRAPFDAERNRLNLIDQWYRFDPEDIQLPRRATPEIRKMAELARTPWLGLVVSVMSQATYVDGYRSPDAKDNATGGWRTWNGNGLDSRQVAIHRAAYAYGYAFATVMPGVAPDGANMARIRGVSPRNLQAFYADPAEDDWPRYALRVDKRGDSFEDIYVYDDVYRYTLTTEGGLQYVTQDRHDAGVCPVVRYANTLDLEGRADGEVEPFIPLAAKINKTDFDRLLAQHFSSWRVITATGLIMPTDPDEAAEAARQTKLALRQDDILIGEEGTQFGTLAPTPLDGLIAAKKNDVETLAAASQTPTSALTGDLINISSDGLIAARAQLDQKLAERKVSFGRAHAQALRMAAHLEGDEEGANDVMSRVTWQDTSVRSLGVAADALGKLQALGVPPQALWAMIPGVSKSDVDDWKIMQARTAARQLLGNLGNAAAQAQAASPTVAGLAAARAAA